MLNMETFSFSNFIMKSPRVTCLSILLAFKTFLSFKLINYTINILLFIFVRYQNSVFGFNYYQVINAKITVKSLITIF
ncbi:hypothetical protein BCT06_13850 [Vibrio breoganii]|nr:hypothetical protein BCT84_07660 [Vibrio breoganii]PMO59988.1 hypothetical protein BCT06_13850 [Vibrio breoganii]